MHSQMCVFMPRLVLPVPGAHDRMFASFRLVNEGQLPVPYVPLITTQYNLSHTHTHSWYCQYKPFQVKAWSPSRLVSLCPPIAGTKQTGPGINNGPRW